MTSKLELFSARKPATPLLLATQLRAAVRLAEPEDTTPAPPFLID